MNLEAEPSQSSSDQVVSRKNLITRRQFLQISPLIGAGIIMTACGNRDESPPGQKKIQYFKDNWNVQEKYIPLAEKKEFPGIKKFLFLSSNDNGEHRLDLVDFQQGTTRQIALNVDTAIWSPDGEYFIATQHEPEPFQIVIYDQNGLESGKLALPSNAIFSRELFWHPDNKSFFYTVTKSIVNLNDPVQDIWEFDIESKKSRMVLDGGENTTFHDLVISPDGSKMVFASSDSGSRDYSVFVGDYDRTGKPITSRDLFRNSAWIPIFNRETYYSEVLEPLASRLDQYFYWSDDGRKIVGTLDTFADSMFVYDLSTNSLRNAPLETVWVGFNSFSPSRSHDKYIVFQMNSHFVVFDTNGRKISDFSTDVSCNIHDVGWSPGDREIIFFKDNEMYAVDQDGTNLRGVNFNTPPELKNELIVKRILQPTE